MGLRLSNCIILHIPKTGSDWVRSACSRSIKGPIPEVGEWHCDLSTAKRILEQEGGPLPFIGTFVRNPLDWYRSAWIYWMETRRFPREDDAPRVEHDVFEEFVRNCMSAEAGGYVSTLFERFTGLETAEISFIGRQETLVEDLIKLLKLSGQQFDESKLRETPRKNVGGRTHTVKFPGFSFELAQEVVRHEAKAFQRFGYLI